MKTKFTSVVLLCTLISLFSSKSFSQTTLNLNFSNTAVLLSGTALQVNAKYRFPNVSGGTDAIVTIVSATAGATLTVLDDNAITKPESFSPHVRVLGNSTGLIEFNIKLVVAGTEVLKVQDSLFATAYDVDGTSTVKEWDVLDLGGGTVSYQSNALEIAVTQSGTTFTGKNTGGIDYPGIDSSAKQVMYTIRKNAVSSFTYKCGAQVTGGGNINRLKSVYFKSFILPSGGPLPVKYASFDATVVDKAVMLKWVTEQEINNNYFEVERSFDPSTFKTIGLVLGAESSAGSMKTYRFKDNSIELQGKSVVYYRLKQIDKNGTFTYSTVLAVKLQAKAGVSLQISPNPFVENLLVRFTSSENGSAQVRILNVNGQVVATKQTTITKGYNNIQLVGLNNLTAGMYITEVSLNGVVLDKQKLIKN